MMNNTLNNYKNEEPVNARNHRQLENDEQRDERRSERTKEGEEDS